MAKVIYPNSMKAEMSYKGDLRLKKIESIKAYPLFRKNTNMLISTT